MLEKKEAEASSANQKGSENETLYLCNFRVSVDGDWLCLKEVDDQDTASTASSSEVTRQRKPPDSLAITPELDRLEKMYPNYPVGNPRGIHNFFSADLDSADFVFDFCRDLLSFHYSSHAHYRV